MTRIVPPFGFKFRMGEMISREGKDFSRKGPLEILPPKTVVDKKEDDNNIEEYFPVVASVDHMVHRKEQSA
jgi:hypothetical protein